MLTKRAKYGLKAMKYLAEQPTASPVLISEISEQENIPFKFLQGILLSLKRHGFLDSKKGKGGGYFLKIPADQINMASLFRVLDGPIALVPCVSMNYYQRCDDCPDEEICSVNRLMAQVRDRTLKLLENETLEDLIKD
ncbi:MAG: Rrf2 family transcriptional regulator [Weeksellaceae bacterium]|nr:Rrf2 family transcriptional regulator [Weeksellaceae bacterium]